MYFQDMIPILPRVRLPSAGNQFPLWCQFSYSGLWCWWLQLDSFITAAPRRAGEAVKFKPTPKMHCN